MSRTFLILMIGFLSFTVTAQEIKTFAPDIISTDIIEYCATFSGENSVYFVRRDARWGDFNDKTPGHIYSSDKQGNSWSEPKLAPFSGTYSDSAPFISPDGQYFFFTSNRPDSDKSSEKADIWLMTQTGDGWSAPTRLDNSINTAGTEYSPVLTKSGNLYFASTGHNPIGQGDIFICEFNGKGCDNVQNLGAAINSPKGEWNVFVDWEETFMIFEASERPPYHGYGDLFISFRENGNWTKAVNMKALNTEGSELAVRLSPNGKTLYFAQSKDGDVDIKMVDAGVIENYRK